MFEPPPLRQITAIPFTPFHFGPVFFAKGCCPNRSWVLPFLLANVLVDCEVLYRLHRSLTPIHHVCHTYVGGILIGVITGIMTSYAVVAASRFRLVSRFLKRRDFSNRRLFTDSVVSGLVGGVSHVFLDSLMHTDMHPFWPFLKGNALTGLVSAGLLHILLAASGFFGVIFWLLMREP